MSQADVFRLYALVQTALDPVDPCSQGRAVCDDPGLRGLLLTEVIGDTVVPNPANERMASAFCAPLLSPFQQAVPFLDVDPTTAAGNLGFRTAGLFQFATSGGEPLSHGTFGSAPEAVAQVRRFFATQGGMPEIIDPFAPGAR